MATVTVSRWYGAGGARVGPAIAQALGFRFVDRELVEVAARQLGVDPGFARAMDERVPDAIEELGKVLAAATPEYGFVTEPIPDEQALADAVRGVILGLAEHGGYVILGRGAQAVLSDRDDVCSLLLVGDEAERAHLVMDSQGIDEKEARARMARVDAERHAYVQRYHRADISDPCLYDAVINTTRLGLDRGTRLAIGVARLKLSAAS